MVTSKQEGKNMNQILSDMKHKLNHDMIKTQADH